MRHVNAINKYMKNKEKKVFSKDMHVIFVEV